MKKTFILLIALAASVICYARNIEMEEVEAREAAIADLFRQVNSADKNETKYALADSIQHMMISLIYDIDSFDYDYPNIPNIGLIVSDDEEYAGYSWNILLNDGSSQYYTIFQNWEGTSFVLAQGIPYKPLQTGNLNEAKWYGCMYYKLIPIKVKDKIAYLAFGYARDNDKQYKYIDVLSFTRRNVKFGAPIFAGMGVKRQTRVVFEYADGVEMNLTWDKKKKRVLFDHLSPMNDLPDGTSQLGPDMSTDALVYKKRMWTLQEDVKVKNKK